MIGHRAHRRIVSVLLASADQAGLVHAWPAASGRRAAAGIDTASVTITVTADTPTQAATARSGRVVLRIKPLPRSHRVAELSRGLILRRRSRRGRAAAASSEQKPIRS